MTFGRISLYQIGDRLFAENPAAVFPLDIWLPDMPAICCSR